MQNITENLVRSNTVPHIKAKDIVANGLAKFRPAQLLSHDEILQQILAALEPVDFRAKAALADADKLPQKHLLVLCIDELLAKVKEKNFDLARKNDFIFAYNGAFWKELDRERLKDFLGQAAAKLGVQALEARHYEFRDKLYKQFLAAAKLQPIDTPDGTTLINLANGTFEIAATHQRLREFRPQDFLSYQLPFAFNSQAQCPIFKAYLARVLPEQELQQVVAEFFGYVFTKHLKLEKALLLYGSGANGKSVLFDVMNALLGRENITNYSLANLLEEHNRALIAHKLLNYGSEINATSARDEFKNLVSGEPIQARLKYGNSFTMTHYAKLAFNCNDLPKDFDHQNAYFRRLLLIPFRVTLHEAEQDKTLAARIIASELAGVFNWILEGLQRLLHNQKFSNSQIVQATLDAYKRESDSVACFCDEKGYAPDGSSFEVLSILYPTYRAFCVEDGYKPLNKSNFKKRLAALGYLIERAFDGNRVYFKKD